MVEAESGDASKSPVFRHLPPLVADLDRKEPWSRARIVHARASRANRVRRSITIVFAVSVGLLLLGGLFAIRVPVFRANPWRYLVLSIVVAVAVCLLTWLWSSGRLRRWFGRNRDAHVLDHRWKRPFDERGPLRRILMATLPFLWLFWQLPNLFLGPSFQQYPWVRPGILLLLAPFLAWGLYRLHGLFWTGTVRVRFEPFPLRPGSTATITVGVAERATAPDALALRLVACRERPNSYWRLPVDVFLQSDTRLVIDDPSRLPASGSDVEIEFPVPDGPSTELSATYPTYWELELHVVTRDGDYVERFLAPVYAAHAAATTDADATLQG